MDDTPLPLIDFAAAVGAAEGTVRRWVKKGIRGAKLRAERKGGRYLIHWQDYRDWQRRLEAGKSPPSTFTRPSGEEARRWVLARLGLA